jgi:hypothetical protein
MLADERVNHSMCLALMPMRPVFIAISEPFQLHLWNGHLLDTHLIQSIKEHNGSS